MRRPGPGCRSFRISNRFSPGGNRFVRRKFSPSTSATTPRISLRFFCNFAIFFKTLQFISFILVFCNFLQFYFLLCNFCFLILFCKSIFVCYIVKILRYLQFLEVFAILQTVPVFAIFTRASLAILESPPPFSLQVFSSNDLPFFVTKRTTQ